MPDNYPAEWKQKFAQGYQEAAENIDKVDTSKLLKRAGPPPETTPHRRSLEDTRKPLPYADTHENGGVPAKHVTADEAAEDRQIKREMGKGPDRVVSSVKGASWERGSETMPYGRPVSDASNRPDDPNWVSPFATAGSNLENDPNATVVSLSQINPEVLADERGPETGPVGFERAESDMSEHDFVTLGPDGVPIAGLMQAGMNEPSGALGAPSELSLQHTTYSGKVRPSLLKFRGVLACEEVCSSGQ